MLGNLPVRDFNWLTEQEIQEMTLDKIMNYPNLDIGYVLEVDLKYPIELHDAHNNYPLACESMIIKRETVSNYNKNIINNLKNLKIKIKKPNLNDKKKNNKKPEE